MEKGDRSDPFSLFHEALHGLTAIQDPDLGAPVQVGANSTEEFSIYIKNHVLIYCPSFR